MTARDRDRDGDRNRDGGPQPGRNLARISPLAYAQVIPERKRDAARFGRVGAEKWDAASRDLVACDLVGSVRLRKLRSRRLTQPGSTVACFLSFRASSALSSALIMADCQSSRDENTRFARLMPTGFNVFLTAASHTFRILPMAMFRIPLRQASQHLRWRSERGVVINTQPGASLVNWRPRR
jgi:hypothetical protein